VDFASPKGDVRRLRHEIKNSIVRVVSGRNLWRPATTAHLSQGPVPPEHRRRKAWDIIIRQFKENRGNKHLAASLHKRITCPLRGDPTSMDGVGQVIPVYVKIRPRMDSRGGRTVGKHQGAINKITREDSARLLSPPILRRLRGS
jgi:hypothetical protein